MEPLLLPVLVGVLAAVALLLWTGPRDAGHCLDATQGLGCACGPAGGADAGGEHRCALPRGPGEQAAAAERPVRTSVRQDVDRLLLRLGAGRSARARERELQVLDGLAAALEAGLPVPRAVTLAVSEVMSDPEQPRDRRERWRASDWDELARAAGQGQALAPAWQRLARRSDSLTLDAVARAWRVASVTGAPLARAIRLSAHVSRERQRLERAVHVATAGARATVTVLTLLPLAGVGLAAALGVSPLVLYSHPVALVAAGSGALLVVVGQLWSRRLVRQVLRGLR